MDTTPATRKEKKGLSRLWKKLKLAIRPKSKSRATSTPTKTGAIQTQTPQTSQAQPPPVRTQEPQHEPAERYYQNTISPETNVDVGRTQSPQMESSIPPTEPSPSPPPVVATDRSVPASLPMEPEVVTTSPHLDRNEPTLAEDENPQSVPEVVRSPGEKEELARRYARFQAVFRKYDLELEESSWDVHPKPQYERVHKAPRMRVRWTCHECKTTFGHDKICVECAHQRCRTCARYPPKKKKAAAAKRAAVVAAMDDEEPTSDLAEGACHECQTGFAIGSQECSNCHHRICERCLQETLSAADVADQTESQPIPTT